MLPTRTTDKFVVFGGITAYHSTDTASSSVDVIDDSTGTIAVSAYGGGGLATARAVSAAVNLNLTGTSNFALLVAGGDAGASGAAAGSCEILIDP